MEAIFDLIIKLNVFSEGNFETLHPHFLFSLAESPKLPLYDVGRGSTRAKLDLINSICRPFGRREPDRPKAHSRFEHETFSKTEGSNEM